MQDLLKEEGEGWCRWRGGGVQLSLRVESTLVIYKNIWEVNGENTDK